MNPDIFTWNTTFKISKCLSALRKEAVTIQPKQQSIADFQKTTHNKSSKTVTNANVTWNYDELTGKEGKEGGGRSTPPGSISVSKHHSPLKGAAECKAWGGTWAVTKEI